MAMKAAATKLMPAAAPRSGLRALLFSTSSTIPSYQQPPDQKPRPAERSTNLYVFGLGRFATTESFRAAFEKFGNVVDAKVVVDRKSGIPQGMGFVRFETLDEAEYALKGIKNQELDGYPVYADYATPRNPSPPGFLGQYH